MEEEEIVVLAVSVSSDLVAVSVAAFLVLFVSNGGAALLKLDFKHYL